MQVGERIRVILDCDDNTLSFEKNYEFLGVAFRGKSYLLFLCSVWLYNGYVIHGNLIDLHYQECA